MFGKRDKRYGGMKMVEEKYILVGPLKDQDKQVFSLGLFLVRRELILAIMKVLTYMRTLGIRYSRARAGA